MIKNDKILYSCLVGGYDDIPELNHQHKDWRCILFTDLKYDTPTVNGWEIKELKYVDPNSLVKTCRWHKLNSHLLFPNCLYSVYVDCNIILNSDYTFVRADELYQQNTTIAAVKHPIRDCIYEEAEECISIGKDTKSNINSIIKFLKKEKYPPNNGLFESGVLFRNHTKVELNKFNEKWWELLNKHTRRDQLTMNYVLWKQDIYCDFFLKKENTSVRNSEHYKFITKHKVLNDIIEITKQEIINKDTEIHEKNLELIDKQNLLNQKEQENQHHINLLHQKESENQHHINLLHQKEQENQHHINLLHQKESENQHHINLLHQKGTENQLLVTKIKRIKRTVSYKVFFKIEIFIKESLQRLFQ